MKNQNGIGLLVTVLMVIVMLVSFLYIATNVSQTMLTQLSQSKRQLAGYKAMQDFAVMAQAAYQTYRYNSNTCPAGTTQIPATKPFCWPDATAANPHCIYHPLSGPDASNPRLICLNNTGQAETMEVISKNENKNQWWKNFLSGFDFMADAQISESHLPVISGQPTISYAATPNCSSAFSPTYCKLCEDSGLNLKNLECIYMRVCLSGLACPSGNDSRWTFQRLGVQIIP